MHLSRQADKKIIVLFFILCIQIYFSDGYSQVTREITIKNNSHKAINDFIVEIPASKLNLKLGQYIASSTLIEQSPVELTANIHGQSIAIFCISKIKAHETLKYKIIEGSSSAHPKRTYAELSHKIGGKLINNKYEGDYSWAKPNMMTLPGSFTDHAYYIKYEGPGWENDKVAFRFYLDNRNAIDVFGKKTSDIILPGVGIDGYDNYHKMAPWGMDNLKVGKSLGLGSIAYWDGEKAVRVEQKDSVTSIITSDGKLRSQVKTIYYGWQINGSKCNLTSLISIDAGSRASHMELLTDKPIDNIATGIIKNKEAKLIVRNQKDSEWSYIATFGKQSLNNDMQGLAIFARTKHIKEITEDKLNHIIILTPDKGRYLEYYFMPTWELEKESVATEDDFMECINDMLLKLNNNVTISHK